MRNVPLDIPPGVVRNGTQYQVGAQGRWYDANLIRWLGGVLAPVGGWARLEQGDAAPGVPRDFHAWRDNSGRRWLAIGTNEGLFVWDGTPELIDITPTGFTTGRVNDISGFGFGYGPFGDGTFGTARPSPAGTQLGAAGWSLDNWGGYLVACAPHDGRLLVWELDPQTPAAEIANSPADCRGLLVTPERHLVALGAGGDKRNIAWCSREDLETWAPAATNTAGDLRLTTEGDVQCLAKVRGQMLLLTTQDVHTLNFVGSPLVYGVERVSRSGGTISPRSIVPYRGGAAWMAEDGFYVYDGTVRKLSSDVEEFVLSNRRRGQFSKVHGFDNAEFNEVWWFYPDATSFEPNNYVFWNYQDDHWGLGSLTRSASIGSGVYERPLAATPAGDVYEHERGFRADGVPLLSNRWIESGAIESGAGDRTLRATKLVPDERTLGHTTATFHTRFAPNGEQTDHGPYTLSERTDVRFSGRQIAVRIEGAADEPWRVGIPRLEVQEAGRR